MIGNTLFRKDKRKKKTTEVRTLVSQKLFIILSSNLQICITGKRIGSRLTKPEIRCATKLRKCAKSPRGSASSFAYRSWPVIYCDLEYALVVTLNVWGGCLSVPSGGVLLFCVQNVNTH